MGNPSAETMKIIKENGTLKKHVGTVQISNPLSLLQRKAFSVLLFKAYHSLKEAKGELHSIPLNVFCDLLGYNSKDFKTLDRQIEKMQFTKIEWMDNPEEFSRVSFFAYTGIKNGLFQYRFDPKLEEKLYHPEIFAKINMLALRQFQSRYSIALYENLAQFVPNRKTGFNGGMRKITLERFRELMGVKGKYEKYKDLKKRVIEPAIKEINEFSGLLVDYKASKTGRAFTHIKFEVSENPQISLGLMSEPQSVEEKTHDIEAQKLAKLSGVSEMQSAEWLFIHGKERFMEVLEMFQKGLSESKIKSPAGWLSKSFSEGWKPEAKAEEVKKILQEEKAEKKKIEKEKKEKLKDQEREEEAMKKAEVLEEIETHLSSLNKVQRELKYYIPFHQEYEEVFKGLSDFINLGADPRTCENEMVKGWFYDFMSEKLKL